MRKVLQYILPTNNCRCVARNVGCIYDVDDRNVQRGMVCAVKSNQKQSQRNKNKKKSYHINKSPSKKHVIVQDSQHPSTSPPQSNTSQHSPKPQYPHRATKQQHPHSTANQAADLSITAGSLSTSSTAYTQDSNAQSSKASDRSLL
jgi:hypothetical protein